jgi:hypothetical protein
MPMQTFFFFHLVTCAYIVWVISPLCPPPRKHSLRIFFFLVGLGFELRALQVLYWNHTSSPYHANILGLMSIDNSLFIQNRSLENCVSGLVPYCGPTDLHLLSSGDYRHAQLAQLFSNHSLLQWLQGNDFLTHHFTFTS